MKLIVGLGNPGKDYESTRHNIGASVVEELARLNNILLRRKRYSSRFGEGKICGEEIKIILPLTYMNLSGEAVRSIVKDKGIDLSDILVICDDADLELGNIKLKPSGSDGGHKGLRSIIEHLGLDGFNRLRIGIGRESNLKDYVLRPFSKDENSIVEKTRQIAVKAIECWLEKGINITMNLYNTRQKSRD